VNGIKLLAGREDLPLFASFDHNADNAFRLCGTRAREDHVYADS
jgi:hypothetical protein